MSNRHTAIPKSMEPFRKAPTHKATGLAPDYFVDSVQDIDFQVLRNRGVKYLVLDVDHTLAMYQAMELSTEVKDFLNDAKRNGVIEKIYLASNSGRDLSGIAASIDAEIVQSSLVRRKPQRTFFQHVLETIGCQPHEAVMVGDKLIFDVWGGNRVGMVTVLVKPVGPDMFFDRLILRRFWGKQFLRKSRRKND